MSIRDRLAAVFRTVFPEEGDITISDALTADDIEAWDSITHINLIFSIEEEFGVQFTTSELESIGCVGDLRKLLEANR